MLSHLHSNAYDGAYEYFSLCGTDIPYHTCVAGQAPARTECPFLRLRQAGWTQKMA